MNGRNLERSVWAVVDQIVCSASNFLVVVIVSHSLLPAELGGYMLVYTAVLMLGGFQQSLVTGPLRVLGASLQSCAAYVGAQLRIQVLVICAEGVLLAALLHSLLGVDPLTIGVAIGTLALLQLQEFVRSLLTTRLSFARLLKIDVLTHGVRIVGLWICHEAGALSAPIALGWIGGSALVAFLELERRWLASTASHAIWRSNWQFARWLLVESIAYMISTRGYLYVVAFLLGEEMVAALSASQNLANAVNVIAMGLTAVAIPVARLKLEQEGHAAWRWWLLRTSALMLIASGGVLVVIAVAAPTLFGWLYPPFYMPYASLVVVLGVAVLLDALNANLTSAFWTAERPDLNAAAKVAGAIVTLAWAIPGVRAFGIHGAAVGLVITPVVWLLTGALFVSRGRLSAQRVSASMVERWNDAAT